MKKLKLIVSSIKDKSLMRRIFNKISTCGSPSESYAKDMILQANTYYYLQKKFAKQIEDGISIVDEKKNADTIWICWLQGIENSPKIVRACLNSVKKNISNKKVVIITEKNLQDYIAFPEFILEKRRKGIISYAHFSDLIRIELLCKYGGIWLDSTVLCTASSSDFDTILNSSLFVYKNVNLSPNTIQSTVCSSWLIASDGNSKVLHLTRKLLHEYWKVYDYLEHYFLFHFFLAMAARKYAEEWDSIPTFNNVSPHILGTELDKVFVEKRWEEYLKFSGFHKLNHRVSFEEIKNSNFNYILKKYLDGDEE